MANQVSHLWIPLHDQAKDLRISLLDRFEAYYRPPAIRTLTCYPETASYVLTSTFTAFSNVSTHRLLGVIVSDPITLGSQLLAKRRSVT